MRVTIVGLGNMGRAIATRLVAGGHPVALVGRDLSGAQQAALELGKGGSGGGSAQAAELEPAVSGAEIVILALPYDAALAVAPRIAPLVGGKVVIDISNPLNESYTGLMTEGGRSGAETVRALLPGDASVVKAFNTTFASTLLAGEVAGEQLDVFLAGDEPQAIDAVAELVRSSGMRAIPVGGLERSRQLEALAFLGISIQGPLGTGYMTGWKLVFPGMATGEEGKGFPRDAVVGVLDDPGAVSRVVTALAGAGVDESRVSTVYGEEGQERIRAAQQTSGSFLAFLFGYETNHMGRHLREVEAGRAVVVVEVDDAPLGERVGEILAREGARFVNYYSRWTARSLVS